MQTKVLIPVDDSPHSRIAVDLAFCYGCITPSAETKNSRLSMKLRVGRQISAQQAGCSFKCNKPLCCALASAPAATAAYPVTPMVPMASSAAIASVQHNVAQQQAVEKEKAQETLQLAKELLMLDYKVSSSGVLSVKKVEAQETQQLADELLMLDYKARQVVPDYFLLNRRRPKRPCSWQRSC
eukprot:1139059-Pelagomonas_calceolata.AAC.7